MATDNRSWVDDLQELAGFKIYERQFRSRTIYLQSKKTFIICHNLMFKDAWNRAKTWNICFVQ